MTWHEYMKKNGNFSWLEEHGPNAMAFIHIHISRLWNDNCRDKKLWSTRRKNTKHTHTQWRDAPIVTWRVIQFKQQQPRQHIFDVCHVFESNCLNRNQIVVVVVVAVIHNAYEHPHTHTVISIESNWWAPGIHTHTNENVLNVYILDVTRRIQSIFFSMVGRSFAQTTRTFFFVCLYFLYFNRIRCQREWNGIFLLSIWTTPTLKCTKLFRVTFECKKTMTTTMANKKKITTKKKMQKKKNRRKYANKLDYARRE